MVAGGVALSICDVNDASTFAYGGLVSMNLFVND